MKGWVGLSYLPPRASQPLIRPMLSSGCSLDRWLYSHLASGVAPFLEAVASGTRTGDLSRQTALYV